MVAAVHVQLLVSEARAVARQGVKRNDVLLNTCSLALGCRTGSHLVLKELAHHGLHLRSRHTTHTPIHAHRLKRRVASLQDTMHVETTHLQAALKQDEMPAISNGVECGVRHNPRQLDSVGKPASHQLSASSRMQCDGRPIRTGKWYLACPTPAAQAVGVERSSEMCSRTNP